MRRVNVYAIVREHDHCYLSWLLHTTQVFLAPFIDSPIILNRTIVSLKEYCKDESMWILCSCCGVYAKGKKGVVIFL